MHVVMYTDEINHNTYLDLLTNEYAAAHWSDVQSDWAVLDCCNIQKLSILIYKCVRIYIYASSIILNALYT